MKTLELVRALTATTSRIDKEQLLIDAFMNGERRFFRGAKLAYDSLVSFGVKKAAQIVEDDGSPSTMTDEDFFDLLNKLQMRKLTGHAARDAIHDLASVCDAASWNEFYRRVILCDLKCGIDESTINKILKKISTAYPEANDYIIPVFACQLAHDGNTDQHKKKVRGVKMIDVKLDGARLLTIMDKEKGTVTQYTRNGKLVESFPTIVKALEGLLQELPGSIVLDGEIVGNTFQELMTQFNRKKNAKDIDAKLALFDILPLKDFLAGHCKFTQKQRHDMLCQLSSSGMLQRFTKDLVYVIPKITVDLDTVEGMRAFHEFNKNALLAKYEGVMLKDPDGEYRCKRSVDWLKIKPVISVTLRIDEVAEGDEEKKYVDMMGALVCSGHDLGVDIQTNVGSGFTDAQRKEFWEKRDELVGFMVEIEADGLTLSKKSNSVYSLRFPRWKGFRGTKPGEKI